jgi:hypothetical protein
MLKMIRNRSMEGFVLVMAAFVSASPTTHDRLPSLFGLFSQTTSWCLLSPDSFLSLFLPPLFSSSFFNLHSFFFFFCCCCHLNFLSSYQVWSDFPFCHKSLRMTPGNMEWVRILYLNWGLVTCQALCHHGHWAYTDFTSRFVTLFL